MPLTARDQRTLKIGGIIVGVLLVAFFLFNLLGGGDEAIEGQDTSRGSDPTQLPTDGPTTSPTQTPTSTLSPVAVFTGRDPFSAPPGFSVSSATTTSTNTSGTSTTTTTSPPPTSGSTSTTTTTTTSPPPTQPGGGSSIDKGGHEVVLLNVFSVGGVPTVQVEVDGTIYDVQVGDEFGPSDRFEVRSISGNCATFVYGDDPFTLCVNPQK
jgi:cytoskeletal protein RodZ